MATLRLAMLFLVMLCSAILTSSGAADAGTTCVSSVRDLNYAGVSNVSPGEHLSKAWRISLCGGGWTYTEAVRVGGDFGPNRLGIPRVNAKSVDIWTPFYAPAPFGRHSARYQIEVAGVRVGPIFALEINTVLFKPFTPSANWRMTQSDHPAWEWADGWNGKARDYAPTFGSCTAGMNLSAAVLPVAPGTVVAVDAFGAYVAVAHANGLVGLYLHVRPINVSLGQAITAATKLGAPSMFGGRASGCHVHVGFATYTGSPPQPGSFNPNKATWLRVFPFLVDR